MSFVCFLLVIEFVIGGAVGQMMHCRMLHSVFSEDEIIREAALWIQKLSVVYSELISNHTICSIEWWNRVKEALPVGHTLQHYSVALF